MLIFVEVNVKNYYSLSGIFPACLPKNKVTEFRHMAELVYGEKDHSDWFPERSVFCLTDH